MLDNDLDILATQVYEGDTSVFDLPLWLYVATAIELDNALLRGFGNLTTATSKSINNIIDYRINLGLFSGAKTFHHIDELTKAVLLPNGNKRPFPEFLEIARKINSTYSARYLQVEQDTVFMQSLNARNFNDALATKDTLPYLKYLTVGDDRVRPAHMALDGIIRHIDDPIWDKITPMNGWRCRCRTISLDVTEGRSSVTSDKRLRGKVEPILTEFKKDPTFNYNPAKVDYVFKTKGRGKHEYFKLPREFAAMLINNFGFPPIEELTTANV